MAILQLTKITNPDMVVDSVWKVVKVYTMPDGQEGVKLQRVK